MIKKGFFKRALAVFSRPSDASAPPAQATFNTCTPPAESPVPTEPFDVPLEPAAPAAGEPAITYPLPADTAGKLAQLPATLQELAAALNTQGEFHAKLEALLSRMSDPREELIQTLDDLASDSRRQSDILGEIQRALAEGNESDLRTASALSRLNESLDNLDHSNAAHVEIMEQMRDRWANAKDETADEMLRHGRNLSKLVLLAVALLAVLTFVEIIRVFVK